MTINYVSPKDTAAHFTSNTQDQLRMSAIIHYVLWTLRTSQTLSIDNYRTGRECICKLEDQFIFTSLNWNIHLLTQLIILDRCVNSSVRMSAVIFWK